MIYATATSVVIIIRSHHYHDLRDRPIGAAFPPALLTVGITIHYITTSLHHCITTSLEPALRLPSDRPRLPPPPSLPRVQVRRRGL